MPVSPGTRFGPYEILSPLGSGGMGEVYLARDTRLGREVAIKVLGSGVVATPELRARFEREARTISSLNHPNICSLFDVGREGDADYLVMERVEGDTLADRLGRGPLPPAEVLKIGAQIADALDRAHRAGIVHRDLKPGNVMLAKTGAKLMDFGLARAEAGASGPVTPASLTKSPTVAQPLTVEGTLVGTFQYMSPEQLEGREADARSDIWAFGCVLYEMATGRRAFEGRSQASLISAIMSSEPAAITPSGPGASATALDRVVRQCLAKDPEDRWQSSGDLKRELEWIRTQGSGSTIERPLAPSAGARGAPVVLIAWAVLATVAALALLAWPRSGGRAADEPTFVSIPTPAGLKLSGEPGDVAISPDGRKIAFASVDSAGIRLLWIRDLADPQPRPVMDSETGCRPFWSPDGEWLAFFTGRERSDGEHAQLKKVRASGGAPIRLCDVEWSRGGTWGKNGDILFVPAPQAPISRISANGGPITSATVFDTARHETSHRFPSFLPDGDHFVYAVLPRDSSGTPICLGSLRSKQVKVIGASSRGVTYAAPGYLVFERGQNVVAQRLDLRKLELVGDPIPITQAPPESPEDATRIASASANGSLAVLDLESVRYHLEWLDGAGRFLGRPPLPSDVYFWVSLSPDGRRVMLGKTAAATSQLVVGDLMRGTVTRIESQQTANPGAWSPDGRFHAITSSRDGEENVFIAAADGSGMRRLPTVPGQFKNPTAWSPDGRTLVFWAMQPSIGFDLFTIDPSGGEPHKLFSIRGDQTEAKISPDGRWLAYQSDETGMQQINICSLADGKDRVQVTTAGGLHPHWSADGREIIYGGADLRTIYSVPVREGTGIHPGEPRVLFQLPSALGPEPVWDYSPVLNRFLVGQPDAPSHEARISLISGWASKVAAR